MVKAVHDVSQDDSSGQLLNGIVPVFIKEIKMDNIDDVLDQIHTHIAKTDNIDPSLQKDFHELDKSIRAMNEVKRTMVRWTWLNWTGRQGFLRQSLRQNILVSVS